MRYHRRQADTFKVQGSEPRDSVRFEGRRQEQKEYQVRGNVERPSKLYPSFSTVFWLLVIGATFPTGLVEARDD